MSDQIKNKVADSGIITIDLEEFLPKEEILEFDIKTVLVGEYILKEKEFREYIKNQDWSIYRDKYVALTCSNDAIVPTWAYMLLTLAMEPFAKRIFFGNINELTQNLLIESIQKINPLQYDQARVVIKGCGNKVISQNAYVSVTSLLKPHVKSLMFGEPCSTVPLYKAK